MLFLIAPDAICENFEVRLEHFDLQVGVELVICRFIETSSEVEAVWDRGPGWTDHDTGSLAPRRIKGKTWFLV